VEELAEFIDPEYLPEEYGGKKPPYTNKVFVIFAFPLYKHKEILFGFMRP